MNLPRGNVLLKPTPLEFGDVEIQLSNLGHQGFSGYVQAESGGAVYYIFLREGKLKNILELSGKTFLLVSDLLLRHRLGQKSFNVASYVFAAEIVDVLSGAYGFEEKYLKHPIRKKEFPRLLGALNAEKITGLLEILPGVSAEGESIYLALEEGHIITDNFLDAYGQIITGADKVSEMVEGFTDREGILNVYGARQERIEQLGREALEELGMYRELVVGIESSGLRLVGGSVVRVDDTLLKEWSFTGSVQKIEIVAGGAPPESFKVGGKKGLGAQVSVPASVQKKLGLAKGQVILARPG